jgi:hypothetical protein
MSTDQSEDKPDVFSNDNLVSPFSMERIIHDRTYALGGEMWVFGLA